MIKNSNTYIILSSNFYSCQSLVILFLIRSPVFFMTNALNTFLNLLIEPIDLGVNSLSEAPLVKALLFL